MNVPISISLVVVLNHDTGMLDIPKTYSYDNNINYWSYIFQNNITYNLTSTTKIGLKMNAQILNRKGPSYGVNDLFSAARDTNPIAFPATFPARPPDRPDRRFACCRYPANISRIKL